MKLRVTIMNKPEAVVDFLLRALDVAESYGCEVSIHYDRGSRKSGRGLSLVPLGAGPVSELEILILGSSPGRILKAINAKLGEEMNQQGDPRFN
jgi:hypothetical protein